MTDKIRINNVLYSWTSCAFRFDGVPYEGITGFDYEQKRERPVKHAARRDGTPIGKPAGKYSVPPCTLTMLRDSYEKLTTQLSLKGLGSYGDAEFTLVVQYIEPVPGAIPIIVVCSGCTIDGEKDTNQEGTDVLVTEVEIGVMTLTRNGKRLWSVVRSLL